jgi:hypothetical protein
VPAGHGIATGRPVIQSAADDGAGAEGSERIPPAIAVATIAAAVLSVTPVAMEEMAAVVPMPVKSAMVPPMLDLLNISYLRRLHGRHHYGSGRKHRCRKHQSADCTSG